MKEKLEAFERLLNIMSDLRTQCPWDKKQTIDSLRNLSIEEIYELNEAILNKDYANIKEELGDVFLHLVFYAHIAEEENRFNVADVLNAQCDKLIHRHPHIYGNEKAETEEEVLKNWEKLKLKEGKKSILEGVPSSMPSINKAYRMQEKTAKVGFEWEKLEQVWDKVEEEKLELEEAVKSNNKDDIEDELGDLFFALINYARFLKIDPEAAIERTNKKFKQRFEYIEAVTKKNGLSLDNLTLTEMDEIWNQAKQI